MKMEVGEMAPLVKCLSHNHKGLDLDLQHPHEKLGPVAVSVTPRETGRSLNLADKPV